MVSRGFPTCTSGISAFPDAIVFRMSFSFVCHGGCDKAFLPSEDCSEEFQRLMQGLTWAHHLSRTIRSKKACERSRWNLARGPQSTHTSLRMLLLVVGPAVCFLDQGSAAASKAAKGQTADEERNQSRIARTAVCIRHMIVACFLHKFFCLGMTFPTRFFNPRTPQTMWYSENFGGWVWLDDFFARMRVWRRQNCRCPA